MFSNGYRIIDEEKEGKKISLEQLRKLDSNTSSLSDEELKKVRQSFYDLGQLMFDNWYEEKFSSKNPTWSLTEKS